MTTKDKDNGSVNNGNIFRTQVAETLDLSPRERILRATYETILEDQISGTRLRKIAEKAGMAQGHLHYYYASKDDLFLDLLNRLIQTFSEERRKRLDDVSKSFLNKLLTFFELKIETIKGRNKDFVLFDFWVQSASDQSIRQNIDKFYTPWRQTIQEIVQGGVESGEFNSKHAAMMPSYMISLMDGAALQYLIDRDAFNLDEYFQMAGKMVTELLTGNKSD